MKNYEDIFPPEDKNISAFEYMVLYNALIGELEDSIKKKKYLIDKYQKEMRDIELQINSIKKAKLRAYNQLKED